jgi:hypothetical protein
LLIVYCTYAACCDDFSAGECDDGSAGAQYCDAGTDSADCGFGPTGIYQHYCDAACGFMCEQLGIQNTVLLVLPPGGDSSAHAIVTNTIRSADKAAGFTAASTGKFAVRVRAHTGNGDLTVSVENVGTALHRSPPLRDDGMPHPLHVDCYFDACTYSYSGGVILDADGRAFDLQFAAEAGTAFAFRAQSRDAVKLKLTVYQQGAAQGADGFPAMVDAAMGSWYSTPPGHQSYAEHLLSIVLHSCQSCFGNQDKDGVEVTPAECLKHTIDD